MMPNEAKIQRMTFGQWCYKQRTKRGMSRESFCDLSGVSKHVSRNVEAGLTHPNIDRAGRMAGVLGFELWEVLRKLNTP